MWAFVAVCALICTPAFRAMLEALFAELSILFLHHLTMITLITIIGFVCALILEFKGGVQNVMKMHPIVLEDEKKVDKKKTKTIMYMRSSTTTTLPIPRVLRGGKRSVWNSLVLVSTVLPIGLAIASSSTTSSTTVVSRRMANTSVNVPFTLSDNKTALDAILKNLTMCKYSKTKECIDNPTTVLELGNYKREPRTCSAFDAAYVPVTSPLAAFPNRYLPTGVEEAYAQGFHNRFSEWSSTNQIQFQMDCPLLYNDTIAKGEDYLCCTENQYEGLQSQVRMIPGSCTACKENLRSVWCQMTCSPSNSMFLQIDQVRVMKGDVDHPNAIFPAIEEATYYVGKDWIRDIYDYCEKDSSFGLMCNANQNCTDGFGLMKFMGSYKFDSMGSPLQINVKTMEQYTPVQQKEMFCPCGETNSTDCYRPAEARLTSCVGVCGSVCSVSANDKRTYTQACYGSQSVDSSAGTTDTTTHLIDPKWQSFMDYMSETFPSTEDRFVVLNYMVAGIGAVLGSTCILCYVFFTCRNKRHAAVNGTPSTCPRLAINVFASERRLSFVDDLMTKALRRWALFVSTGKRPYIVLAAALSLVIVACTGLIYTDVETDPVKLWTAETSRPYKERQRYGELFMPFYRTEQVILVPKDGGNTGRKEYLKEAIRIQELIAKTTADMTTGTAVTLDDICWKATGTACTVNSITQYFQNRMDHFEVYDRYDLAMRHFSNCIYSPENADLNVCSELKTKMTKAGETIPETMSDCPCLSAFGAPMNLYNTYLGGFPAGANTNTTLYLDSTAIVSTALVYNYYELANNAPAIAWERQVIKLLKEETKTNTLFDVSFMVETSVQDEIDDASSGDSLPVALSYSLMIVYVSLGINRWKLNKGFFVTSKIVVGFLGIICIVLAVVSTIGFFMWTGAKLQLVIMEVVPFLTLAIGVDNIFLLVHAMTHKQDQLRMEQPTLFGTHLTQGTQESNSAAEHTASLIVSEALAYIGPSIFMASFAESVAFGFGCISPMPAVLWFAAFSAVAVGVNWCLQMSLFLVILTLDKRRELKGHLDLFQSKATPEASALVESAAHETAMRQQMELVGTEDPTPTGHCGLFTTASSHFFDRCVDAYAHLLSLRIVKLMVLLVFLLFTLLSIPSIETIDHGLPQQESMPSSSYLINYFNTLDKYLATGPPIFFVVEGGYGRNPPVFDLNKQEVEAMFCKSKDFCAENAIPKMVDALANELDSNITHFAKGVTYSWMDDFWAFINPDNECCRVDNTTKAYLPIQSNNVTYTTQRKTNPSCLPTNTKAPPVPEESFMSLFGIFSTASAGAMCSYGGGSIYRGQFSIDEKPIPVINAQSPGLILNGPGYGKSISAFSYMLVSTANPTQKDFINTYKQARRAAEWISEKTGIDVWAYCLTFVFFDQYLTVVEDTYMLVGFAIAAIFVIHVIYFGSLFYPLVIALAVTNIIINVMGLMAPNDIMLNGLSVVNLIIAAGISVEFCGHFVRMFAKASGSGDDRAKVALRKVLTSVLFGITITKIVGLSALTLADSRIFQKYYFRMYMSVVLCGVLNGMVLLPVVLSLCVDAKEFWLRRKSNKEQAVDGGMEWVNESPSTTFRGVSKPSSMGTSRCTGVTNSE